MSFCFVLALYLTSHVSPTAPMERIALSADGRTFIRSPSGRSFRPLGFNYDHDENGRLLEDYWHDEWSKVEADFREMRDLGANVVRIHLQFGKFMTDRETPNAKNLNQLSKLLTLAESCNLYLDLTGLGCYHKPDVPQWYDALDEPDRWTAQSAFWTAVANRCKSSPAVFCYDLMNEPVVPGGKRKEGEWLGPPFAGKYFVQFISLNQANRPRPEIASQWTKTLADAVRAADPDHLVTVGLVDWSLDRPGLTSGFTPQAVAPHLDFLAVHLYPEKGKLDDAKSTLLAFAEAGKLVVIEETFPLKTSTEEFDQFLEVAQQHAAGLIGFYWGQTPEELRAGDTIGEAITLQWLETFQRLTYRRQNNTN